LTYILVERRTSYISNYPHLSLLVVKIDYNRIIKKRQMILHYKVL